MDAKWTKHLMSHKTRYWQDIKEVVTRPKPQIFVFFKRQIHAGNSKVLDIMIRISDFALFDC